MQFPFHRIALWSLLSHGAVRGSKETTPSSACSKYKTQAQKYLHPETSISCGAQDVRWSEYGAPNAGAIATIRSEDDVAALVAFCSRENIPFLVQSGANGWADTFTLDKNGLIIDVSNLKDIAFDPITSQMRFQTGATNKDMVQAAWNNNVRLSTSTCNCVSYLGATLGGGLSRTQGLYGVNVDQLVSVNYVDSEGHKRNVSPQSEPDLWWALMGAGANFGIVTSAVARSYPVPQSSNTAWTGSLIFEESKLKALVDAVENLNLEPAMQLDLYYTTLEPSFQPAIIVTPFYVGSEEQGRAKFAPILALSPVVDQTQSVPYNRWNDAGDGFCARGGRKPVYSANVNRMDATAWCSIWNDYVSFIGRHPEAVNSTVLAECYSTAKSVEIGSAQQSSFPFRDVKCFAFIIPLYADPTLDGEANQLGLKYRDTLLASAGTEGSSYYINFAHGDEPLDGIYGRSLPRLLELKKTHDPHGRFNQWFPLN